MLVFAVASMLQTLLRHGWLAMSPLVNALWLTFAGEYVALLLALFFDQRLFSVIANGPMNISRV